MEACLITSIPLTCAAGKEEADPSRTVEPRQVLYEGSENSAEVAAERVPVTNCGHAGTSRPFSNVAT